MSLTTKFTVIFPNGFTIKKPRKQMHPLSEDQDTYEKRDYIEPPSLFDEEHIPFTLQELLSNFYNIDNTYKSNPDKLLDIDKISKFITNEEMLKKHVLTKIDGKIGRCIISKKIIHYNEFIYYIPILKETKKKLLILFNTFIKCSHEDIIIYENTNTPLFIHLFAIIIDSLHVINPLDINIKNCTDIFPLITLLEILLNKKYKAAFQKSRAKTEDTEAAFQKSRAKTEDTEAAEAAEGIEVFDDDWDKDDFDPTTLPIEKPIDDKTIEKNIDDKIDDNTIEKNTDIPIDNKSNDIPYNKSNDISDEWDSI